MSKYQMITHIQPSKWILPVFLMFHGLFGENVNRTALSSKPVKSSKTVQKPTISDLQVLGERLKEVMGETSQNQQFSFAKHALHLLYTTHGKKDQQTLQLRSLEDQKDVIIYSTTSTLPHTAWSPHSQHLGVFFEGTTLLIDAEKAMPITKIAPTKSAIPAHLWEKTERSPTLYIMNEKGVVQVTEKQTRAMYQHPSSSVWYIDEDSHLWITNEGKHTIITQIQTAGS